MVDDIARWGVVLPPSVRLRIELSDQLRRTQVMIEETRQLMNRSLEDWIKPKG
jgi:hypothetical protein